MDAYKKALWFGWTRQALQPPRMPDSMRERYERVADQVGSAKQSPKPQKK